MKIKQFKAKEKPPFNNLIVGSYRGHKDTLAMTRGQVLYLQFSKLLNYFPDVLSESWGGGLGVLSVERLAMARFSYENTVMATEGPCWLHRRSGFDPWGPDNWVLKDVPNTELGSPFEPFICANGAILSINQGKRLLGVDSRYLIGLKLQLLLDELVILECIKKLLRPPPLWSRHLEVVKGIVTPHEPPTPKQ